MGVYTSGWQRERKNEMSQKEMARHLETAEKTDTTTSTHLKCKYALGDNG